MGGFDIDIFVIGSDGAVYQKHWNDFTYSDWVDLGGNTSYAPAAVALAPDNIAMFVIGRDGQLWGREYA